MASRTVPGGGDGEIPVVSMHRWRAISGRGGGVSSYLEDVTSTAHPALEFHQHQLVGAVDQREICHGAIPLAAVMQGEAEVVAAEPANLRITAHDDIEAGPKPSNPNSQFRPGQRRHGPNSNSLSDTQVWLASGLRQ